MNNEEFRIVECAPEKIVTNREPQNEAEISMMRNAVNDAMIRQLLQDPPPFIQFKD